jgi:CubicO group peptidase (beta-lactamase class C family)
VTYGFILSGLVRAITGRTVGEFFADEIAGPLKLDLYVHRAAAREARQGGADDRPPQRQAIKSMLNPTWLRYILGVANRRSASYRATFGGTSVSFDDAQELIRYEVEDPSAGAVGNGPPLARMFAALIGEVDSRRLVGAELMNAARQPQASGRDAVLRVRTDWCLGFLLPGGPMWPNVGVPGIFGFPGRVARLALLTPNTNSRLATRPACGPISPVPSPRQGSGFRRSPKPSISARVYVCGPRLRSRLS